MHDALHAGVPGGHEHVERALDVDLVGGGRVLDRVGHGAEGGLMQHVAHALHGPPDLGEVAEVALDQLDAIEHAVEVLPRPAREVVEDPDVLLVPDQLLDEVGPDEPRAAGDQVHGSSASVPTP